MSSEVLRIAFAGSVYAVAGATPAQREIIRARYGPLFADATEPEVRVEVELGERSEFQLRPTVPTVNPLVVRHEDRQTLVTGIGFSAVIERPSLRTQLRTCLQDEWFVDAFENPFRALASLRLFSQGALVLHSGAFTDGQRGFLFCGRSGAGKSTLCSLAQARNLRVLSDELNAIRPDGNGYSIHAMPFAGDFGGLPEPRRNYPLTALLGLHQGDQARLSSCSRAQAISRIVAACPYVNTDPGLSDALWVRAAEIVDAVPMQILAFAKNDSFWSILDHDYPASRTTL